LTSWWTWSLDIPELAIESWTADEHIMSGVELMLGGSPEPWRIVSANIGQDYVNLVDVRWG